MNVPSPLQSSVHPVTLFQTSLQPRFPPPHPPLPLPPQAFRQLAKETTTLVMPANASDPSGMVAQVRFWIWIWILGGLERDSDLGLGVWVWAVWDSHARQRLRSVRHGGAGGVAWMWRCWLGLGAPSFPTPFPPTPLSPTHVSRTPRSPPPQAMAIYKAVSTSPAGGSSSGSSGGSSSGSGRVSALPKPGQGFSTFQSPSSGGYCCKICCEVFGCCCEMYCDEGGCCCEMYFEVISSESIAGWRIRCHLSCSRAFSASLTFPISLSRYTSCHGCRSALRTFPNSLSHCFVTVFSHCVTSLPYRTRTRWFRPAAAAGPRQ